MNLGNILTAIVSIMFFMIGADKFLGFLDPPCSIETLINPTVWKGLGVLQILGGILIWLPKFRRPVAVFFIGFMTFFTGFHLINNTYDVGGAAFMAVLLGLLLINPGFLRGRTKS